MRRTHAHACTRTRPQRGPMHLRVHAFGVPMSWVSGSQARLHTRCTRRVFSRAERPPMHKQAGTCQCPSGLHAPSCTSLLPSHAHAHTQAIRVHTLLMHLHAQLRGLGPVHTHAQLHPPSRKRRPTRLCAGTKARKMRIPLDSPGVGGVGSPVSAPHGWTLPSSPPQRDINSGRRQWGTHSVTGLRCCGARE